MKKISILFFVISCLKLSAQVEDAWVYFKDKQNVAYHLAYPITILTQKSIDRKNKYSVPIDDRDVPVNETYISQIKNTSGITVLSKSKWFNAVHVRGTQTIIESLLNLNFVNSIDFANKNISAKGSGGHVKHDVQDKLEGILTSFNYGNASNQIEMFNGHELHMLDYTGDGMTVAVLDAGFPNVNTMTSFQRLRNANKLLGSYDFVNRRENVYTGTTSNHGTLVLSDMAGFVDNEFVGTAPDAAYYLFITENALSENPVEESYWVEAAERADSLGVDIINTSLGYTTYDNSNYSHSRNDMDGYTAFISKGANIAFEKGLLLVTSAGNSGNGGVGAPADSPNVLSIGAVKASGTYTSFSSVGSAIQPTQKPDVVAQGDDSYVITEDDIIATADGTSFSSPIMAGGVACLWQALPDKTNTEIMQLVRESASQFTSPDYYLGYGIPNLQTALNTGLSVNQQNSIKAIKWYPNPVDNKLYIKLPEEEMGFSIKIVDVLGKKISSYYVSTSSHVIDVTSISKGLYMVKLESKTFSETFKFIKK